MQKYFYVALGGSLGSLARYWVGSAVASKLGTKFPYGTFVINVTACLIIGFSIELLGKHVGTQSSVAISYSNWICRRVQHVLYL